MKTSIKIIIKGFLLLFIAFLAITPAALAMQQKALNRAQILAGHILAGEITKAQSIAPVATHANAELSDAEKNEFIRYMLQDEGKLADIDVMQTPTGQSIYYILKEQAIRMYISPFNEKPDAFPEPHPNLSDIHTFINNRFLKVFLFRLIRKEYELKKSGYITYIHGQKRVYYWPEKLYTILYGIRYQQEVKDFLFAHVHDVSFLGKVKYCINPLNRSYIGRTHLCMNHSLFNITHSDMDATTYITRNTNFVPVDLSAKDVFDYLGYSYIYQQFASEIHAIEKEYKGLCKYGIALLVAIPESKEDYFITHDAALATWAEYRLPMTYEKGLNPASGIKIFPLITGDPEKLAELEKREEALFAAIKKTLEKNN